MIKNKAAKALIIGTCLIASSMSGVYADTNNVEVKSAIVEQSIDDSKMMEVQILASQNEDALIQKQKEIDDYVFVQHGKELEDRGILVTHTGIVGEFVEVGITPFDVKSADYLYGLFGKDMVTVVAGDQAVPLEYISMVKVQFKRMLHSLRKYSIAS